MATAGKKGRGIGWWFLYGIIGIIDGIQLLIGWTGLGTAVSEALEVVTPFFLVLYCQFILKVSVITKPRRLISLFAITGLDAVTGGIAPFWVIDVWYIQHDVKREDAEYVEERAREKALSNITRIPLNQDEVRLPYNANGMDSDQSPLNANDIRPARRNVIPVNFRAGQTSRQNIDSVRKAA